MRVWAGVVVVVLFALAGAQPAAAASFTVTRTDDPVPDGCLPSDCSLREAVLDANAAPGSDAISLPEGHYRLTIPGAGEDSAATGDLDLTDDVSVTGTWARGTVIDATGGDRVFDVPSGVEVQITGVTVTGGQVAGNGGGIRNFGTLGLVQDAITGNHALGSGGGIDDDGHLTVLQSLIADNQASVGGGLRVSGQANLESSTIGGNVAGGPGATGHGGGVDGAGGVSFVLSNSTLTGNQAFNGSLAGAGIDGAPYAQAVNSILASNIAHSEDQATSALANCADPIDSAGHNLSDGTDCGLGQPSDQQGVPVLLGPLADNGGPTDTQALLPGSPALDEGTGCLPFDQRGVTRPRNRACDIGAYEYAPPLVTTGSASSVAFSTATLNATVDPGWRATTVRFEWGRTAEYGNQTPAQLVLGNGQIPVSAQLTGLRQGITYHFRLAAANSEGASMSADQTFTTMDRTKPVLSVLRVVPGLFHRRNGATLAFTLSENATVTFRFDRSLRGVRRGNRCVKITRRNRRRRPCTRYLPVAGSVVQAGAEGPNSIHFDAKVGTKLLAFGAYRLRATPRDAAGNVGKTAVAAFRVLR
jgi:hypothetical protein